MIRDHQQSIEGLEHELKLERERSAKPSTDSDVINNLKADLDKVRNDKKEMATMMQTTIDQLTVAIADKTRTADQATSSMKEAKDAQHKLEEKLAQTNNDNASSMKKTNEELNTLRVELQRVNAVITHHLYFFILLVAY
jgi:adenylosuccinate synthase